MLEEGVKQGRPNSIYIYNTSRPTINYFIHDLFWQVSVVATQLCVPGLRVLA